MGSSTSKPTFNVERYIGRWYELARYPNSYEIGCQDTTIDYSRSSNQIRIINRCGQTDGRGTHVGGSIFRITFSEKDWIDYSVLSTDYDNYAFIAGNQGRFWILGRDRTLDPKQKSELMMRTRQLGYDPDELIWN